MKAFFVAQVTVKNTEKFQQYAKQAGASMEPFGGQVITKGKLSRSLAGDMAHENIAIVSFPDSAQLDAWFNSDAYQHLIPLRDEAADMILSSYSSPD